ncbi:uncharacterized protein LAESUDRAFT_764460 [Laetiporus sulphureus 93-53]|uniref:Uncharacterized protein n=1 Tax=Laetiporus sulphureus 93-53 TaxID=1314785 RepID=A0A165BAN0_9APHY|nr:uncharacterized protein LAESUDRAFT_764460 [Laetiporus sulphureus 93-53]KZT00627.1 hypothetical protein LAESUDRAFT_764460 [Laetiporus sulphureus 93-53]
MSLIVLHRIIKAADQFAFPHGIEFWYMLLDTNSSLYELAPSGPDASSYRLAGALKPLPVWCYVNFDQMRRDVELKSAEQALLIRFLAMFSRPYWHTLGDSPDVVRAARKKLIYHDEFDPENLDHVFAIFANRIVLELSDRKQSSQIAVHAIHSHMRLLTDVSDGFIVTNVPSEPMLAVAAADILNGNWLLFILTRDKVTLRNGGSFVDCSEPARHGVRPLKLSDFLTTLLGDDLGVKDQDKADQVQDLLSDVGNVWMNFTHWTQTDIDEEISIITPEWLFELWCRGVAVQCTHGQSVFDSLVVTYRGDLTQPFVKRFLGYIVIHTKARMEASALEPAAGLAGPVIETTDESGQPVRYKPASYIALFMDFTADSTYSGGSRTDIQFGIPKKSSEGKYSSWIGYLQDSAEEKRYCLNVRGNDNQSYPVITKDIKTQFGLLFAHTISTHGHFTKAACAMESAINPISSRLLETLVDPYR